MFAARSNGDDLGRRTSLASDMIRRIGWARTRLLVVPMVCVASSLARSQTLDIGQYAHTAWRVREGFIKGQINAIAQTPDGYLWLGTDLGLLRFDGVRVTPWTAPLGKQLPGNLVGNLLVARDSTLWIGTRKGLVSWKDGTLTEYPAVAGRLIGELVQSRDGTIWFGTLEPGELCSVRGGRLTCDRAEGFGYGVATLLEDRQGNLWLSGENGLWRRSSTALRKALSLPPGAGVISLIDDDSGGVLIGTPDGLRAFDGQTMRNSPLSYRKGRIAVNILVRSRDGALWMGTGRGLLHLRDDRIDEFDVADGLSGGSVTAIFEDREGNVWVGTDRGLDRFRAVAFPTLSVAQGLATSSVWAIQATADSSVWMGGPSLQRWTRGRVETFEVPGSGRSLGLDSRGRLWASSARALYYFDGRQFARAPGIPGGLIFSIVADDRGLIWILNTFEGLYRVASESSVKRFDLPRILPRPTTLVLNGERGGLWMGSFLGGLAHLTEEGQVIASYTTSNGLGAGRVAHLRRGADGAIWASTHGGLSRVKDERIATLTSRNGLPCDAVHWSIEDDDRALWLYMPCGLVRIARSEIDGWISDAKRVVKASSFDADDGVMLVGELGSIGPPVTKSPDGKIWFVSAGGVSVIDPRHLWRNTIPPPVHVEQIVADGTKYKVDGRTNAQLRLPARTRNLAIDYTALSLAVPERVRFRFKLEGQDREWREVINQRHVEYSNLPPGSYRFRLTASNNSGLWNGQGTVLEFSVAPAFYQTNWFRMLAGAAILGLLWAAYRLRIRQLRLREARFQETVETMPAMAFIALPDGARTFCNRRWTEYTGLSLTQASGVGWQAAVHPDDLAPVLDKWRVAFSTGAPLEYEIRLRGADGVFRWFFTRVVPLKDGSGRITKWYGVATDIEERKRAEQERERFRQIEAELAHLNRVTTIGELTASLSHEIRQPIAATMMNASLTLRSLDRKQPNLDKVREAANRILRDGARANEIITRLRLLYRKSPTQREPVDVNAIIREVLVLLQGEARRHSVGIRIDLSDDLPTTMGDRVQIQQVFLNLMLNGIEAMKDGRGGQLTVASQLGEGNDLVFSVSDTGVGVPPDKAEQIFAAFFTTKAHGSGMGLSICRLIVESHGGKLWATANSERGATFHFTLRGGAPDDAPVVGPLDLGIGRPPRTDTKV